jgi:hypothetical protein
LAEHIDDEMTQDVIELHVMYEKAFRLFQLCSTQWRTGMSGVTGLDYVAVDFVARANGIKVGKKLLQWLQVMEGEALKQRSSK